MSRVNNSFKVFGLGLLMLSSTAMAGEYDGFYDIQHSRIGGAADVCVFVEGVESCYFADVSLRLEDGQVTEQTMVELADNTLGNIEDASGQEFPPKVEEILYVGIEKLFLEAGDEINEAIKALPVGMSIYQFPFAPDIMSVELVDAYGSVIPAFGNIALETGHYDVLGIMQGGIDKLSDYDGYGAIGIPVDQEVEKGDVYMSIRGSLFSEYDSWLHREDVPPPPPEEEPTPEEPTPGDETPPPPPEEDPTPGGDEPPPPPEEDPTPSESPEETGRETTTGIERQAFRF